MAVSIWKVFSADYVVLYIRCCQVVWTRAKWTCELGPIWMAVYLSDILTGMPNGLISFLIAVVYLTVPWFKGAGLVWQYNKLIRCFASGRKICLMVGWIIGWLAGRQVGRESEPCLVQVADRFWFPPFTPDPSPPPQPPLTIPIPTNNQNSFVYHGWYCLHSNNQQSIIPYLNPTYYYCYRWHWKGFYTS